MGRFTLEYLLDMFALQIQIKAKNQGKVLPANR